MKRFRLSIILMCAVVCLSTIIYINTVKAQGPPHKMDIAQTLSDGAQGMTIAFDGLAFITGDFCSCTFIPPGKVADYFGFQYLRDNDITHMGHNTDFNTAIANNLLYVLTDDQKAQIISIAKSEAEMVNQYAYDRFPLMKAFNRLLAKDIPQGSTGLDKKQVMDYSAQLYRLDGKISIERAKLYSSIMKALDVKQKHYLDSVAALGMLNMPVLPEQIDKRPLNNDEFTLVMSFAGDIFSWYAGNIDSDVYFCPERQGDYFGSFYLKDAPAVHNSGYSIDTNLTQNGGARFLATLTTSQALLVTSLVDTQRTALYTIVSRRTDISNLLRTYLTNDNIDTATVLSLSEQYGELDGEISYYYATNFAKVGWTLTNDQRDTLMKIRNLDKYPCTGAYKYADTISLPDIENTDFFFNKASGINELRIENGESRIYPNPADQQTAISFQLSANCDVNISLYDITGRVVKSQNLKVKSQKGEQSIIINTSDFKDGVYIMKFISPDYSNVQKIVVKH